VAVKVPGGTWITERYMMDTTLLFCGCRCRTKLSRASVAVKVPGGIWRKECLVKDALWSLGQEPSYLGGHEDTRRYLNKIMRDEAEVQVLKG
jgi:hypothetical protein